MWEIVQSMESEHSRRDRQEVSQILRRQRGVAIEVADGLIAAAELVYHASVLAEPARTLQKRMKVRRREMRKKLVREKKKGKRSSSLGTEKERKLTTRNALPTSKFVSSSLIPMIRVMSEDGFAAPTTAKIGGKVAADLLALS